MHGASVLKILLLVPVALVLVIVLTVVFFEGRKAYWDHRVREMCEKDGGIVIIEHVHVTAEQAAALPRNGGFYGVAPESLMKSEEMVFSRTKQLVLKGGSPSVFRYETEIVRRSDRKIVGRVVEYGRGDGDFPSYAFPSSFHCPEYTRVAAAISGIFQIEESKK